MSTETKCLEYARECARRARLVTNPELRERLLNLSRTWTERATREPNPSAVQKRATREPSSSTESQRTLAHFVRPH
jgi:hypothetical protein